METYFADGIEKRSLSEIFGGGPPRVLMVLLDTLIIVHITSYNNIITECVKTGSVIDKNTVINNTFRVVRSHIAKLRVKRIEVKDLEIIRMKITLIESSTRSDKGTLNMLATCKQVLRDKNSMNKCRAAAAEDDVDFGM